jgi:preprotein translocase subunit SecG
MTTVIIVIHLMVVVAMVGLVLLQRSEGGALGIGGGSGAFMSGRGAANMLTRSTGILAAVFFVTSFGLALLARYQGSPSDIFDTLTGQPPASETPAEPTSLPATGGSAEEMLRQLEGSTGPQTPPSESGSESAPASGQTDDSASLPVPDTAPVTDFDGAPTTGSDTAPTDGGASPQTPPAQ